MPKTLVDDAGQQSRGLPTRGEFDALVCHIDKNGLCEFASRISSDV